MLNLGWIFDLLSLYTKFVMVVSGAVKPVGPQKVDAPSPWDLKKLMPRQALKRNGASKHGGDHSHSHGLEVNGTSKHGGDHSHTHVLEVNGTSKHGGGRSRTHIFRCDISAFIDGCSLSEGGWYRQKTYMHACSDVSGL